MYPALPPYRVLTLCAPEQFVAQRQLSLVHLWHSDSFLRGIAEEHGRLLRVSAPCLHRGTPTD